MKVSVPTVTAMTLSKAIAALTTSHLVEGTVVNESGQILTDLLWVLSQNPASGTVVDEETKVDMLVDAITQGVAQVTAYNQNSDGRSVDLYEIDHASPNNATPRGTLAYGNQVVLSIASQHIYDFIAVDSGLDGCPDGQGQVWVGDCRRSTVSVAGSADQLNYNWNIT